MTTNQQHCPACGRWLKRPRLWCERPYCYDRVGAALVAAGHVDDYSLRRVLYRANNYRAAA